MTAAVYGQRKRARSLAPAAEPNVIPFIDVLLVLLIIFMVTAPKPTVDLQLQLPAGAAPPLQVLIPPTIVEIDAAGDGYRIFIGDREIALEDLSATVLAHGLAVDAVLTEEDVFAEAHVFVRARDQGVAYGAVVAVLDELKHAGFQKVGVFAQSAA